jgi:hypothetical protein
MKKIYLMLDIISLLTIFILIFFNSTPIESFNNNILSKTFNKNKILDEIRFNELKPGDIAFKHPDIFPDYFPTIIDHCLLFIEFNESTNKYIFIEAGIHNSCVQYRNETKENITDIMWGPFARVRNANLYQKNNAINFTKRQLGKKFQGEFFGINANKNFNPEDIKNDIYADEWYCSELIWAAYYNCDNPFPNEKPKNGYKYGEGIDIDRNGWKKNIFGCTVVWPKEILNNVLYVKRFNIK